jgi:hypothetical protein
METTVTDAEKKLLQTMKRVAPGFYTESDDGPWYVVTPDHDRIAEDFVNRNDAMRSLCWLAGEDLPSGWAVTPHGSGEQSFDIEIPRRPSATIWVKEARRCFPDRIAEIADPAYQPAAIRP